MSRRICREPDGLRYTLDHLAELVVKPVGEAGGYGITIGPQGEPGRTRRMPGQAARRPGQLHQPALYRPVGVADPGRRRDRAAPCRSSAVRDHRASTWVLPGGLTRVALRRARWSSIRRRAAGRRIPGSLVNALLARYADCIFWLARYVERAENLARILDVNETFSRDSSGGQNWLSIVAAQFRREAFFEDQAARSRRRACCASTSSTRDNPTSIVSAIDQRARERAHPAAR